MRRAPRERNGRRRRWPHEQEGFDYRRSRIYRKLFGIERVWVLHEAADTSVFHPHDAEKTTDVVWVGNWGDEERSREIQDYLLRPAEELRCLSFTVYGVRYPDEGQTALRDAGIRFGGYLPNLDANSAYSRARLTLHIPRRQYTEALKGIPTIRVFEALACGTPLISAPWEDSEQLFREGDLLFARNTNEMIAAMEKLLADPAEAEALASHGRETILARHTCAHRAAELTSICEGLLQ